MKTNELVTELEATDSFKEFKKENPDTFFAVAFFILNLENKATQIQLDYFLPKQNKLASFEFPNKQVKIHEDEIKNANPQETNPKIDIDQIENKVLETLKNNNTTLKPTKIIAILKDNIWNLTAMDNSLGIIRLKLNAESGEQLSFNKGSLMDFMGIQTKKTAHK